MKTRFLKAAAVVLLVSMLALSMTGCDSLDYRGAIQLYNTGYYDDAAALFSELGDYEDSAALMTRSQYMAAAALMEQGNCAEALPRFLKLGAYEDSPQRVTECTYQIAVAEFDAGNLSDAQLHFQEVADYKQSSEYLRQISWQNLFDAVAAAGTASGGSFTLQTQQDGRTLGITADSAQPNQLIFSVSASADMGYKFHDDLTLTLTRERTEAVFNGSSSFTMDFGNGQIGSYQKSSGVVDIPTCTPDTQLVVTGFEKSVTDNLGKTTRSTNPADSLMQEDMQENFQLLLSVVPRILTDAGIEVTLAQIGFEAMAQ